MEDMKKPEGRMRRTVLPLMLQTPISIQPRDTDLRYDEAEALNKSRTQGAEVIAVLSENSAAYVKTVLRVEGAGED
jgi:hypothetical protein